MNKQVIYHFLAIPLPLNIWLYRYIFQFTNTIPLIRYHTNSLYAIIFKQEHFTTLQITVNHRLLLVCK